MEARGYRGSIGRVSFHELRLQSLDCWAVAGVLVCAAITVASEKFLT
jgi:energy-coupling factor transporter transmembrane protein EcfT